MLQDSCWLDQIQNCPDQLPRPLPRIELTMDQRSRSAQQFARFSYTCYIIDDGIRRVAG